MQPVQIVFGSGANGGLVAIRKKDGTSIGPWYKFTGTLI